MLHALCLSSSNGKQAQTEMRWDWLNFGARYYDGMVGRWASVDPLADQMSGWSSYNYVFNNPIVFTDPTGMAPMGEGGDPFKQFQALLEKAASNVIYKVDQAKASVSKAAENTLQAIDQMGNAFANFVNTVLPEGTPQSKNYESTGHTIGSGFEQMTNNSSAANGTAPTSFSAGSSSLLMVDEMFLPSGTKASNMAAREGPQGIIALKEWSTMGDNTVKAISNIKANNDAPGVYILPGQKGSPDTTKVIKIQSNGAKHITMTPHKQ